MVKCSVHMSAYVQGIEFINQEIQSLQDKIDVVHDKKVVEDIYDTINILKEMKKEYFRQLNGIQ